MGQPEINREKLTDLGIAQSIQPLAVNRVNVWGDLNATETINRPDRIFQYTSLSFGEFSSGDDLRKADLRGRSFVCAQLGNANLIEARFDVQTLIRTSMEVVKIAISPDGRAVAFAGYPGHLHVYNIETNQRIHSIQAHEDQVSKGFPANLGLDGFEFGLLAYSSDGLCIASSWGHEFKIWDSQTGLQKHKLADQSYNGFVSVYSPDGEFIASGSSDASVRIWHIKTEQLSRTLAGHTMQVSQLAYSPNALYLASVGECSCVKIWMAMTGELLRSIQCDNPNQVRFSPDGMSIVCFCLDTFRSFALFETGHLDLITDVYQVVSSHTYSPDGKYIFFEMYEGHIRVYNAQTGKQIYLLPRFYRYASAPAYYPRGTVIAYAFNSETVVVWDAQFSSLNRGSTQDYLEGKVVSWSPDGRHIAATTEERTIIVFEFESNRKVHRLKGHLYVITWLSYSPDGRLIVSGDLGQTAIVWDALAGSIFHQLEDNVYFRNLVFSPDGQLLAYGNWDKTVSLWDTRSGSLVSSRFLGYRVMAMAFRSNQSVVFGNLKNSIDVWNPFRDQFVNLIQGINKEPLPCIAISRDGRQAASVGSPETVRVWNLESTELLCTYKAQSTLESIEYSPSGRYIASIEGLCVRIWESETGQVVKSIHVRVYPPASVCFSDDEKHIAVVRERGSLLIFQPSLSRVLFHRFTKEIRS